MSIYHKKAYSFKTTSQIKKFNTVRNLTTFYIVFTYKNGMDRFENAFFVTY